MHSLRSGEFYLADLVPKWHAGESPVSPGLHQMMKRQIPMGRKRRKTKHQSYHPVKSLAAASGLSALLLTLARGLLSL